MTPDVIVIGGGVIGSAITYQLARQAARVMLFDPGLEGQASAASAGVITAHGDATPGPLRALALEGARLYPALCEELVDRTGIDPGLRAGDVLYLARTEAEEHGLRQRRDRLARAGVVAGWLDAARIRDLEPGLDAELRAGLHVPRQHQVDAPALVRALRRAAEDLGARVRPQLVDRLDVQGERVIGVQSGGERLAAGEVVVASGAWAGAVAGDLGHALPVRPVRGQMVGLHPAGSMLRTICFGSGIYLLRKPDGWIYVGATVEEAGFEPGPTAAAVAELIAGAVAMVPSLKEARFSHAWAGLRPATPDAMPLIGRVPGRSGITIATGHFRDGVLLAPITAELVADLIGRRRPRLPLEAFDPGRFRVRAA